MAVDVALLAECLPSSLRALASILEDIKHGAHSYNTQHSGGRGRRFRSSRPASAKLCSEFKASFGSIDYASKNNGGW